MDSQNDILEVPEEGGQSRRFTAQYLVLIMVGGYLMTSLYDSSAYSTVDKVVGALRYAGQAAIGGMLLYLLRFVLLGKRKPIESTAYLMLEQTFYMWCILVIGSILYFSFLQ